MTSFMLSLSLIILGITSLVSQVVLTRELMISFYGNEFFIGWILFGWLLWVGIGSAFRRFFKKCSCSLSLLVICHLLIAFLIPLEITLIRVSKSFLTVTAGQIPDFIPSLIVSLFIIAPLCILLGAQFTVASVYFKKFQQHNEKDNLVGRAYFWEALGFVLGGLIFSFYLVALNEFQISAILILLNLIAVVGFLFFSKDLERRKNLFIFIVGLFFLGFVCLWRSQQLNTLTAALRFPNEQLVETKNSIYGNLAVTRTGNQYNFYQSGLPSGADKDDILNEHLVHFPMLSHVNPQKVLLVGTGFNGALREILKYNPQQIFYAAIDPALVDLAGKYISPSLRQGLEDRRVIIIKGDLRHFLNELPTDFDVVIINLPNPSTALINRYFTDDFFKKMRLHLKSDGVLSTHLAFSADTVSVP
ncbi:MAG: hypothetical protein WCH62_09250, partial [Candidatus Omnitrophota bacterium]